MRQEYTFTPSPRVTRSSAKNEINLEDEPTIRVHRYRLCKNISRQEPGSSYRIPRVGKTTIKREKEEQIKCTGRRWTEKEEALYRRFVIQLRFKHPTWAEKSSHKKRLNYFTEMSKFIKTRTAEQCRSHDQKMRKKYINEEEEIVGKSEEKIEEGMEDEEWTPNIKMKSAYCKRVINYNKNEDQKEEIYEKVKGTLKEERREGNTMEACELLQVFERVSRMNEDSRDTKVEREKKEMSKEEVKEEDASKVDEDFTFLSMFVKTLRRRMIDLAEKMVIESE